MAAMPEFENKLNLLANISFEGKGESFVEQRFLTPLLEMLGYDSHKDYEVIRHGDDGSSFKLKCPPVENGNKTIKTYNPDYVPTIRKKTFWVIEAKAPKSDEINKKESIVQGLQYCVHPEIQAKYLFLSDGDNSKIFDIQRNYFGELEGNIYEPILEFRNTELREKWETIFNLLSPEKIREKIERNLVEYYEKICLSSLDENYPKCVSGKISSKINEIKSKIRKNVNKLRCESIDQSIEGWKNTLSKASDIDLLFYMGFPFRMGGKAAVPAVCYVKRLLKQQISVDNIFELLVKGYEKQTVFRKQNTFAGLCELHNLTADVTAKEKIRQFIYDDNNRKMNAFNIAETVILRFCKKLLVITLYDPQQKWLETKINSLPEIIRFVNPPNPIDDINSIALVSYFGVLPRLQMQTDAFCENLAMEIKQIETSLEEDWKSVVHKIPESQKELFGIEYCGLGCNIDCVENIVRKFCLNFNGGNNT